MTFWSELTDILLHISFRHIGHCHEAWLSPTFIDIKGFHIKWLK